MPLRNGKDRDLAPTWTRRRVPAAPINPPLPTPSTSTNIAPIPNPTSAVDSAYANTPIPSVSSGSVNTLEMLAQAVIDLENQSAGRLRDIGVDPSSTSNDPPLYDVDELRIETVNLADAPSPVRHSGRSIRPTTKVVGQSGPVEAMARGVRKQRPQVSSSSRPKSSNLLALEAIHHQATASTRAARTRDVRAAAESVIPDLDHSPTPPPTPEPVPFESRVFSAVHDPPAKDPIKAKSYKDAFAFRFEEWRQSTLSSLSGREISDAFHLTFGVVVATISSSQTSFKSTAVTVDDDSDWQTVLDILSEWKRNGCRSSNVHLKTKVVKTPKLAATPNPSDADTKFDPSDDIIYVSQRRRDQLATTLEGAQASPKSTGKAGITEKMLAKEDRFRELDVIARYHTTAIIRYNTCKTKECTTSGLPCVVIKGMHVKVMSDELGGWSDHINKHTASLGRPHDALMEALTLRADILLEKQNKTKKGKDKAQRSNSSSTDDEGRHRKRSRHRYDRYDNYQGRGLLDAIEARDLVDRLRAPSNLAARPHETATVEARSSPIRVLDDAPIPVNGYVDWLQARDPKNHERWAATGLLLEEECVTLQTLPKMTTTELQGIKIPLGHAKTLIADLKKFLKHQSVIEVGSSSNA